MQYILPRLLTKQCSTYEYSMKVGVVLLKIFYIYKTRVLLAPSLLQQFIVSLLTIEFSIRVIDYLTGYKQPKTETDLLA